jgi:phosphoribosylcarboxyaminoimidazole (NCAIR) mutase
MKAEVAKDLDSAAEVAICVGGQHPWTRVPKALRIWFEFGYAIDLDIHNAHRVLNRLNDGGVAADDVHRLLVEIMPWSRMASRLRRPRRIA